MYIFDYDMNNKKITPILTCEECYEKKDSKDIGEMFSDFLNIDLTDYVTKIDKIIDFYDLTRNDFETKSLIEELYDSYNHMYISLSCVCGSAYTPEDIFQNSCYDLKMIQSEFRNMTENLLSEKTSDVYSEFNKSYGGYPCYAFKEFNSLVSSDMLLNFGESLNLPFYPVKGYTFDSPESALMCEFFKLLETGIRIKKCSNCGRYFVVKNLHDTDCCSRKCQQAFADAKQREKINNHPILKLYAKVNKRMSARKRNGKLTPKEYADWVRKYTDLRNEYAEKYNNETDFLIKKQIEKEFFDLIESEI